MLPAPARKLASMGPVSGIVARTERDDEESSTAAAVEAGHDTTLPPPPPVPRDLRITVRPLAATRRAAGT
jgi:hypothetical protein